MKDTCENTRGRQMRTGESVRGGGRVGRFLKLASWGTGLTL